MAQLKSCPYCKGTHRKRSAWLRCAKKNDKSLKSWGRLGK